MGSRSDATPTAEIPRFHTLVAAQRCRLPVRGVIWSGSKAHAVELTPAEATSQEAERANADRVALLGRLQLAGIASRRAGPPRSRVTKPKLPPPPTPASRTARSSATWPGSEWTRSSRWCRSRAAALAASVGSDRITLASGYGDVVGTRRPACACSPALPGRGVPGHRLVPDRGPLAVRRAVVSRPKGEAGRCVSAHYYGRAVDISSIGGIPVIGNQQPGGIVDWPRDPLAPFGAPAFPGDLAARPVGPVVPAARPRGLPPRRLLASAYGYRRRAQGRRHRRVRRLRRRRLGLGAERGLRPHVARRGRGDPAAPGPRSTCSSALPIDAVFLDQELHVLRVAAGLAVAGCIEARREGRARATRGALRSRWPGRRRPPRPRL